VSIKRGIRAILLGGTLCLLCFVYLPRCGLRIAPDDVSVISFGVSGVFTVLAYRFS
jgi:hypothetical protein